VITVTKKEKQILKTFGEAIPKMSESEKERLLVLGEAISLICDKSTCRDTGQTDKNQKAT